jgi:predicted MPP superfamily phosphohydrolase
LKGPYAVDAKRRALLASLAGLGLSLALGVATGYQLHLTRLDLGLGRKVLHLPDVHVHREGERDYVLQLVASTRPDVVILAGDLWDALSSMNSVLGFIRALKRLAHSVVHVPGNHEHWSAGPRLPQLLNLLEDEGVVVLRDEAAEVQGLRLAGIDWRENPKHYSRVDHLVENADVVAVHSPDAFKHLEKATLVLAGHTHGGQVCLPGGVAIATNSIYGYRWGLYRDGSRVMYVARGVGEMIPPRAYCSREALLVE